MALRVVQSPGCREIYSDDELGRGCRGHRDRYGDIAASGTTRPDREQGITPGGVMRGVAIAAANDANLSAADVQPSQRAAATDGHRRRR